MRDIERRILNEEHVYACTYVVSPMFNEGHEETDFELGTHIYGQPDIQWGTYIYVYIESARYSMRDFERRPSSNVPHWISGRLYIYIHKCPSLNQPDLNVHEGRTLKDGLNAGGKRWWYNTAQEASWMWVFDPVYNLLFDVYYCLRTKLLHNFH